MRPVSCFLLLILVVLAMGVGGSLHAAPGPVRAALVTGLALTTEATPQDLRRGDTLTVRALLTRGAATGPVDAYLVVRMPGGEHLSLTPSGLVSGFRPYARSFVPVDYSGAVASLAVPAGAPAGTYVLLSALTTSGTLNIVSPIAESRFTIGSSAARLLQLSDFSYEGAFRMPSGTFGSSSFDYGGTSIAFNATRGSLFVVGHDWDQEVAEISGTRGSVLVRCRRPLDGIRTAILYRSHGRRYRSCRQWEHQGRGPAAVPGPAPPDGVCLLRRQRQPDPFAFRVRPRLRRHGRRVRTLPRRLAGRGVRVRLLWPGPLRVAGRARRAGPERQLLSVHHQPHVVRSVGLSHRSRDNRRGRSGASPGAFVLRGVVFPDGAASVLFFGRQGIGPFCYGTGEECNDPADAYKGTHAYPYRYYIWAYDATDLAAVRVGTRTAWSLRPYAVWAIPLPFAREHARILGATWDPAARRIFVSQAHGDGDRPLVHVFRVR